ncbi:hypothetical protein PM082_012371 [Marasmius tenuissimus]|nr:hypothetical protein PM082_012371 [Marasmius tenuissimus]
MVKIKEPYCTLYRLQTTAQAIRVVSYSSIPQSVCSAKAATKGDRTEELMKSLTGLWALGKLVNRSDTPGNSALMVDMKGFYLHKREEE